MRHLQKPVLGLRHWASKMQGGSETRLQSQDIMFAIGKRSLGASRPQPLG